jgi:hypothetical protein
LTGGILWHFQAFSTPKQNPALGVLSIPTHPQVTQTVGQPILDISALKINKVSFKHIGDTDEK